MVATVRTQETGYEAMVRLAEKARAEGVKLYHDPVTGSYVASSGTDASKAYVVTPHSCECQGWAQWGRCKHVAALHAAIGWIAKPGEGPARTPQVVDVIIGETIPAPVCRHCGGTGSVVRQRSRWIGGGRTGYRNEWSVIETCEHCTAAQVAA